MDLTLVQGGSRHQVTVNDNSTVEYLMSVVTKETLIPSFNQKLIYKGLSITKDTGKTLADLGIKNKSKIMVIGQKHDPEEEKILKGLEETSKSIENIQEKVTELSSGIDGVEKGFMEASLLPQALEKLKKTVLHCTEQGMKTIESLDGLSIEEKYKDARSKKKQLINKIQAVLDDCDKKADKLSALSD